MVDILRKNKTKENMLVLASGLKNKILGPKIADGWAGLVMNRSQSKIVTLIVIS